MTASADPSTINQNQFNPEEKFNKYTSDLDLFYKNGTLTEYENFDDQFLVLLNRDFPNISMGTQLIKTFENGLDFNNPLSIIEFDKRVNEAHSQPYKAKTKQLNPLSKESMEQDRAADRKREARGKKIASFTKRLFQIF